MPPSQSGASAGAGDEAMKDTVDPVVVRGLLNALLVTPSVPGLGEQSLQSLELLPVGVFSCDASGRITFFNRRAAELWGRAPRLNSDDERFCAARAAYRLDLTPLVPEEQPIAVTLREGRAWRDERVLLENAAGTRWIASLNIDPVRDAAGGIAGAIAVFHDVTPQRRGEQSLVWQRDVLEQIVHGVALEEILEKLALGLEELAPRACCVVVHLAEAGGTALRLLAAGRVPEKLRARLAYISCATASSEELAAVAVGRRALVELVSGAAPDCNFAAAWAVPVLGALGTLLGVVTVYRVEDGKPTSAELELVEIVTRSAAIAIERRRAEKALHDSEGRFRAIVRQSAVGVAEVDPTGRILLCNQRFCDFLGYTEIELLARTIPEITHPDDLRDSAARRQALREGGPDVVFEKRYVRKDGGIVWAITNASAVRDADGRLLRTVAMVTDITARKRAEQNAALFDRLLRELVPLNDAKEIVARACAAIGHHLGASRCYLVEWREGAALGAVVRDWHTAELVGLVGAAPAAPFAEATLRQRADTASLAIADVLQNEITAEAATAWQAWNVRALALSRVVRGTRSAAALAVTTTHARVWTAETLALLDEALARVWPLVEKARADAEARESTRRLEEAMRVGRLGDWMWDATTEMVTLSGAPAEIIGVPSGTALPRAELRTYLHPDDVEQARDIVARAMAERTAYKMEYRLRRPSGAYEWMAVQGTGVYDAAGTLLRVVGVMQEVSERRAAEDRLREQEERLRFVSTHAPMILLHVDRDHRYLFANKTYAERFNLTPEQLIGKKVPEIVGEKAYAGMLPNIERVLRGERVEFETEIDYAMLGRRYVKGAFIPDFGPDGAVRGWLATGHDLTDRWKAEQALRDSQERLRLVMRMGKLGVWDWDVASNAVTWTDSLYEIHGVSRDEFVPRVEGFTQLVHPEDRGPVERAIRSALEHDVPYELEFRAVKPRGGTIWLFANGVVMRDATGKPLRMLGATLDITARKAAELGLRESETRFRALASNAPVGIFLTDAQGECVFANDTHRSLAGLPMEELRGAGWKRALHPDDRERVLEVWTTCIRERRAFALEHRFLRPDGSVVWLQTNVVESRGAGGSVSGYIGTAVDVTQRRLAEDALRESEKRFRTLASHAPVGIFLTDPKGDTLLVNESWSRMTGLPAEAARERSWARAIHPEDRARVVLDWQDAVARDAESQAEYRFVHDDGRITWVHGHAVQLRDEGGRLAGYIGTITDVTHRKQAEEQLRAQEAQLRLVTEYAPVSLAHCDASGRFLFVNRAYAERFERLPEEIVGRTLSEVLGAEARAALEPYVQRVLKGEALDFEMEIPYRDIGRRFMRVAYTPDMRADGEVVGWLSAIVDITERRELELAVRRNEERFRLLADNIAQFAWMMDAAGKRQWANRRFLDYTGLTLDEYVNGAGRKLVHPDHAERVQEKFRRHVESGEPWEDIFPFRGKGGEYRWFLSRAVPIYGAAGKVESWFGTNTDITDLRESQSALRRHNERLELISTALATLLDARDPDAPVKNFLPRVAQHLEAETFLQFMHDEQAGDFVLHAHGGLPVGADIAAVELAHGLTRIVTRTGRAAQAGQLDQARDPHVAHLRAQGYTCCACEPFVIEGRVIGTLSFLSRTRAEFRPDELEFIRSIARYVTLALERARAQAQLQAHAAELEQRVAERTASLREAIAQMEEFSYSVSHDLRAPLRAMNAYAQALVEDFGAQLDPTARGYLERIQKSSARMEQLTHDVLTYSRMARTEISLEPIDVGALVRDLAAHYVELQPPAAVLEIVEPLHRVSAHEVSFGQCLGNLLTNATKFVAPGVQPHIRVRTELRDGGFVRVWVEDNGIGIDPRYHDRLFRVFERVPTRSTYDGTGIGLAIVRKAAEKMGGRCGVESDGVNGSRFWIELPAAP